MALFSHPGVLSRLALWLVEALRDRLPGTAVGNRRGRKGRKSLPFVAACLNEREETYIVVGVMAALDFGDVRKKLVSSFPLLWLRNADLLTRKASRHSVTRPTQVILPLSPNHNLFGNDGLYSESKILFNRWSSESRVSLPGGRCHRVNYFSCILSC